MLTVRYTAWDGTQRVRLSAADAFGKLAEYLSFTDDVEQALDWMVRQGLDLDDERVLGLDTFLDAARERLRESYESGNLRHALDEVRRRLDELLADEGEALARAGRPGVDELREGAAGDPAATIDALRGHEFADSDAREEFDALLEEFENVRELGEFVCRYGDMFRGSRDLGYEEALALMRAVRLLNQLEDLLQAGDVEAVDPDLLESALGEGLAGEFERLRAMVAVLRGSGYLLQREGRTTLSPKGVRCVGRLALQEMYQGLLNECTGAHQSDHRGARDVRPEMSRPYQYGDPFRLDVVATLKNAAFRGCGVPLHLQRSDFAVYDTTHAVRASTVLLLDMSWSMSWEGRFAAAKKVALAMESLIRSRYPRDYFGIVGFYTRAVELKPNDLPEASWNMGDPFTNLQDGLHLAGELLARHPSGNQCVIVITDGQPTAYFSGGHLYCEWPLSFGGISVGAARETLREVERISRRGIVINTFMLDDNPSLRAFVEQMTRVNRGRALFTRPDQLGHYLLVDFIARKRKRV